MDNKAKCIRFRSEKGHQYPGLQREKSPNSSIFVYDKIIRSSKGFTLVELLISLGLLMVLVSFTWIIGGNIGQHMMKRFRSSNKINNLYSINSQLERDLYLTQAISFSDDNSLLLSLLNGKQISYNVYNGTVIRNCQELRKGADIDLTIELKLVSNKSNVSFKLGEKPQVISEVCSVEMVEYSLVSLNNGIQINNAVVLRQPL